MADDDATAASFCAPPAFAVEAQGHKLEFKPSGPERLDTLLKLIGKSRKCLKVCFYIFATDECGAQVRDALTDAARRGVDVHVILDGFGALADEEFFKPMIEAGGAFCRFIPKWTRRYLIRNHQKIVVADSRIAMLGGFNVEEAYFATPDDEGWVDLGFTVEGPIVEKVEEWFDELEEWVLSPKATLRSIRRKLLDWDGGSGPVRLLIGGPTGRLSSWARGVSEDLMECDRLDMAMAYFSPSRRLSRRIRRIGAKGQARLLLPAKSDHGATIRAARSYHGRLLRAGVRIWEFEACRLHLKMIVLDDTVYIGSANFDARSLFINMEIVLCIADAGLAQRLREFFDSLLPASQEITREVYKHRATWVNRMRWRIALFFVVAVDYALSRRLNP
jgi:cardiolipin synthase